MSSVTPGANPPRLYHHDCRHFTGYKPCGFGGVCEGCGDYAPVRTDVLLINLDAMGDVLRTTALLPAIRRAHPDARITWLTLSRAAPLLQGNPLVDRVLTLDEPALIELRSRRFDLLLNVDKSRVAGALAMQVAAGEKRGFGLTELGAIVPLNPQATYLYDLGLDDQLKFHQNQKSEPQLLAEALGFAHARDPYTLVLDPSEAAPGPPRRVGFNTGCSPLYPYKKLPLETQAAAIATLADAHAEPVLLLGGPEDTARNAQLVAMLGDRVEPTPTRAGLRRGAAEVARCDVVVTGDSLGMHLAIALQKHVVVWFGVTCPQEIDLYGRGVRVLAEVGCAPCWRKTCDNTPKCFDQVDPDWLVQGVARCLAARADGTPLVGEAARLGAGWWTEGGG